jgi:hypothetical protein
MGQLISDDRINRRCLGSRRALKSSILMLLVVGASILALFTVFHFTSRQFSQNTDHRQRMILDHTNPRALQAALSEIWNKRTTYRQYPGLHPSPTDFSSPDPSDPSLPPIVKGLQPSFISLDINRGSVYLHLGQYRDSDYGFSEFTAGGGMNAIGAKEIIPGLWRWGF